MPRRASLCSLALWLGASVLSCGPRESALIVTVPGWPDGAARLRLLPTFSSTPGKTLAVEPGTQEFAVVVPPDQTGTLELEGMVQDSAGCYVAGGRVRADFSQSASPQAPRSELVLSAYPRKSCAQICSSDGWCWENPLPQGNDLLGIWGDRPDNFWAVGATGTLLRWDGASWKGLHSPTKNSLYAVWAASSGDVWAVGSAGTLAHFDGQAFSLLPVDKPLQSIDLKAVWGTSSSNIWAVGSGGAIIHYDGITWSLVSSNTTNNLFGIWGSDDRNIWAFGQGGTILRWNGNSWTGENPPEASGINFGRAWGSGPDDVWVSGFVDNNGKVLHWNGSAWRSSLNISTQPLQSIWGDGTGKVWAVGNNNTVVYWDGVSWTQEQSPNGIRLYGIAGTSAQEFWAVGELGTLHHHDATGWHPASTGATAAVYDVWAKAPEVAFSVGGGTQATAWKRSADSWQATTPAASTYALAAVWSYTGAVLWAVGPNGVIRRWSGNAWSDVVSNTTDALSDIWGFAEDDIWAVGARGRLVHWNGTSWSPTQAGTVDIESIWGIAPNDVWTVGQSGNTYHYNGVSSWVLFPSCTTKALLGVWGNQSDRVLAVGVDGTVCLWNGTTWTGPLAGVPSNQALNKPWGNGKSEIWIPTNNGEILNWNGSTWRSQNSGTLVPLRSVYGIGPGELWAVGYSGTILHRPPQ